MVKGVIGIAARLTGLSAHGCWREVQIATIGAELIARLTKRIPVLVLDAMNGLRTKHVVLERNAIVNSIYRINGSQSRVPMDRMRAVGKECNLKHPH